MGGIDSPAGARRAAVADRVPASPRAPRQTRGRARVDTILDAAATAIAQDGLAGVTMHALAQRAQTSIGSLYHFFPDRESVFDALFERHRAAIREISRQLGERPAAAWQQLSVAETIECLAMPYIEYLQQYADYLPLTHGRTSGDDDADFIRAIRHVLDARLPGVERAERETYAIVLHAIGAGTIQVGLQTDPLRAGAYLREIPRVLAAYLADIEAAARQ